MIGAAAGGHHGDVNDGLAPQTRVEHASRIGCLQPGVTPTIEGLVEAHFDFIWRSLRRLGLPAADADDATQEVFLVASRRLNDLEVGRERSFLFGTALRVASLWRRTHARHERRVQGAAALPPAPVPNPEDLAVRRRNREVLDLMLDELPLDLRAVFVLFELEELSVLEIARLLELKPGTAASRLRRAREGFQAAVRRWQAREAFCGGTP